MPITPMQIIFIFAAGVTLIAALMVAVSRKMMHAALWLILTLFGTAVMFALMESGFFAVVQVVVYIGAIAILIIFAVMLTRGVMSSERPINRGWWIAAPAIIVMMGGIIYALSTWSKFNLSEPAALPSEDMISQVGVALTAPDQFLLPFEIVSVLLLAALIGSIYIASRRKGSG